MARTMPATTVVVLSDHGFRWGEDRPVAAATPQTPTAVWWHRSEGIFVAAGGAALWFALRGRLLRAALAPAAGLALTLDPALRIELEQISVAARWPADPDAESTRIEALAEEALDAGCAAEARRARNNSPARRMLRSHRLCRSR